MPIITQRKETTISKWIRLVRKCVVFGEAGPAEIYHSFALADYVAALAVTPDGRIPLVRQFRPAVEEYTYELPAGLLEAGELPEDAARRERNEETGLNVLAINHIGTFYTDTGRLQNRFHSFFVDASNPATGFVSEPGITVEFVTAEILRGHIKSGQFNNQMHLGVLKLAEMSAFRWDRANS